jgi:hypothetical protein
VDATAGIADFGSLSKGGIAMSWSGRAALAKSLLATAVLLLSPPLVQAKIIALDIDIVIDQVSPEEPGMKIGMHHKARIFYDDSKIDSATRRVCVLHQQHTPMLIPKHLDPLAEPMMNAWLDLSAKPYRYHYAASPVGGNWPFPYAILFDEQTMRMTIRKQSDGTLLLAGPFTVNTAPITGPDVDAVVASSEPLRMPWEKGPAMKMAPHAPETAR